MTPPPRPSEVIPDLEPGVTTKYRQVWPTSITHKKRESKDRRVVPGKFLEIAQLELTIKTNTKQ